MIRLTILIGFLCQLHAFGRPNVILIMTDDQGYGDFGFMGNPVLRTPNLDAMAGRSARMTQFYVSPVCSPTRASLMTGRYNYRTRVVDTWIGRSMMEPEETTLAEVLKAAGYQTGIFGKWHLGDEYPMRPQDQGFAEVLVHKGGGIGQPSDPIGAEGKYTDPILQHNGKSIPYKGYCTDIYFDNALTWMEHVHDRGQNFFAYIAANAPHSPFHDVPEGLYRQYLSKDLSNERFPNEHGNKLNSSYDHDTRARIFAMITNIDDNMGRLFAFLHRKQITGNTVVIYLNDNGPNRPRYRVGLRGMKTSVYEGGIKSPLLVQWLGHLQPGVQSDRISAHIDVMPTILDACGVDVPDGLQMDGRSLLPLLQGRSVPWPRRHLVFQTHRGAAPVLYHHFAIRSQDWKLVNHSGFGPEDVTASPHPPQFELFDMNRDPYEMNDVKEKHPQVVAKLKAAYEAWFTDVSGTRVDNYAPPRIHIGSDAAPLVDLTRQDWISADQKWSMDQSMGSWLLHAVEDSVFEVRAYRRSVNRVGIAKLHLNDQIVTAPFSTDQQWVTFPQVTVSRGKLELKVVLELDDPTHAPTHGPWRVQVEKRQ